MRPKRKRKPPLTAVTRFMIVLILLERQEKHPHSRSTSRGIRGKVQKRVREQLSLEFVENQLRFLEEAGCVKVRKHAWNATEAGKQWLAQQDVTEFD